MTLCKNCGRTMQMLSADLDWCQKCGESEPGTDMNADAEELARYRAMFPVAPWDDGPITADVCERLWMQALSESRFRCGPIDVVPDDDVQVDYDGRFVRCCRTAGQLACLVAARRAR